jgi:hypothetical protein
VSCTTDGGGNVVNASRRLFGSAARPCLSHRIQLVLKRLITENGELSNRIAQCEHIARLIRHVCHFIAMHNFSRLFSPQSKEGMAVVQHIDRAVSTRWNSFVIGAASVSAKWDAICSLCRQETTFTSKGKLLRAVTSLGGVSNHAFTDKITHFHFLYRSST